MDWFTQFVGVALGGGVGGGRVFGHWNYESLYTSRNFCSYCGKNKVLMPEFKKLNLTTW